MEKMEYKIAVKKTVTMFRPSERIIAREIMKATPENFMLELEKLAKKYGEIDEVDQVTETIYVGDSSEGSFISLFVDE